MTQHSNNLAPEADSYKRNMINACVSCVWSLIETKKKRVHTVRQCLSMKPWKLLSPQRNHQLEKTPEAEQPLPYKHQNQNLIRSIRQMLTQFHNLSNNNPINWRFWKIATWRGDWAPETWRSHSKSKFVIEIRRRRSSRWLVYNLRRLFPGGLEC